MSSEVERRQITMYGRNNFEKNVDSTVQSAEERAAYWVITCIPRKFAIIRGNVQAVTSLFTSNLTLAEE